MGRKAKPKMRREDIENTICPKCLLGTMTVRRGRYGLFAACNRYPDCRGTITLQGDDREEPALAACPKCGREVTVKRNKYGPYFACIGSPACDFTEKIRHKIGLPCPMKCGGDVIYLSNKVNRNGKGFYGCTNYPEKCQWGSWGRPTGENCPKCGWAVVENWKGPVRLGSICQWGLYRLPYQRRVGHVCDWKKDFPPVDDEVED